MADANLSGSKIIIDKKRVLGSGSFGKVFAGTYQDKEVAVKRMDKLEAKLINREISILRDSTHENVIKYIFHEEDEEFTYIVLEKCTCTLRDAIRKTHEVSTLRIPPNSDIMLQSVAGLAYLHSKKIVHRDIKPSNLLLYSSRSKVFVKISDFGISKTMDMDKTSITASVNGTVGYKSSEVLRGLRLRNISDVFSLGVVFFELLTEGHHPFSDDRFVVDMKIRDMESPNLSRMTDGRYRDLISNMLAHDTSCRITAETTRKVLNPESSAANLQFHNEGPVYPYIQPVPQVSNAEAVQEIPQEIALSSDVAAVLEKLDKFGINREKLCEYDLTIRYNGKTVINQTLRDMDKGYRIFYGDKNEQIRLLQMRNCTENELSDFRYAAVRLPPVHADRTNMHQILQKTDLGVVIQYNPATLSITAKRLCQSQIFFFDPFDREANQESIKLEREEYVRLYSHKICLKYYLEDQQGFNLMDTDINLLVGIKPKSHQAMGYVKGVQITLVPYVVKFFKENLD